MSILNVFKKGSEIKALQESLNTAINAQSLAERDLNDAQDVIEKFMVEKRSLLAKISLLEEKTKVTAKVINNRVNTELANIGVSVNTIPEPTPKEFLSPDAALSQYEKMAMGAEKTAFYNKNEKLILAAISKQHNQESMLKPMNVNKINL